MSLTWKDLKNEIKLVFDYLDTINLSRYNKNTPTSVSGG